MVISKFPVSGSFSSSSCILFFRNTPDFYEKRLEITNKLENIHPDKRNYHPDHDNFLDIIQIDYSLIKLFQGIYGVSGFRVIKSINFRVFRSGS